ncbi:hypothetical protein D9M68_669070 [compost metagenome]
MHGHVPVLHLLLAEADDLADGAAAVAGRWVGVLHLEVVVVFLLLKAQDLSLQGMKHGGWGIHALRPFTSGYF